ncbi:MAG: CsbD family protein [Hyphomicrobium sp.]
MKGTAKQVAGKVKQAVGSVIGSDRLAAEGHADEIEGTAQKAVGDTKKAVGL